MAIDTEDFDAPQLLSVLESPLAESQLDLLEAIWSPCAEGLGWPVWDYVARRLFRRRDPILEPGRLLSSLPRVPRGIQLGDYGLVWRSDASTSHPNPDQRVGLSIAGLHALRVRDVRAGTLADSASEAIGVIAQWERELEPEWDRDVSTRRELNAYLAAWTSTTVAPTNAFVDVLQREWAPIHLERNEPHPLQVTLRMHLAPYFQVRDAATYLDLVGQQVVQRPRPAASSPLAIAQMLDYLSLTLSSDREWTSGPILVTPNLRAAGVIAQSVGSDVEFRDRMSALATLIETLSLPVPSKPDGSPDPQQKSLGRLQAWLLNRLDDPIALQNVEAAIQDLRAAVHLRVEGQHSGSRPQAVAAKARVRLGLPDVIFDWGDAWELVRGRVVDALNVICVEVRSAE